MTQQALPGPPLRTAFAAKDTQSGISWPWLKWLQQATNMVNGQLAYSEDTHANRPANYPASAYPLGSLFYETDRRVSYLLTAAGWTYVSGIMLAAQATLPADLGANDVGFLAEISDFAHLLRWTGTAWTWAPGDLGSGFIQAFFVAPSGVGWHLCDGSTVDRLNADGTKTATALPDYAVGAYLKLSTIASPGPNTPLGQAQAVGAGTPAGVVTQTSPVTSGDASASGVALAGIGATLANQHHTHDVAVDQHPTFAGSALAAHTHGPGTLEPENTQLCAYFRQ